MAADAISCLECGRAYSIKATAYECEKCGGMLTLCDKPVFDPIQVVEKDRSLWRYRHVIPLPAGTSLVSLGEGGTPLVRAEAHGIPVHYKLEYLNPTGSFKDRGTTVLASMLRHTMTQEVVEDSSGNAAASLAAYAARAAIRTMLFVPETTSQAKLSQSLAHGASVIRVPGPRQCAADAARAAALGGKVYASHVCSPWIVAGTATCAFEIWEQAGRAPDVILVPLGQGSLLLGLYRGFKSLLRSGMISEMPRLVGIQAEGCAPFRSLWQNSTQLCFTDSIAEGIRVRTPLKASEVLHAIRVSRGKVLTVSEEAIEQGQKELAYQGFYVEPTSAVVVDGLRQMASKKSSLFIVAVLTGHGLKTYRACDTQRA